MPRHRTRTGKARRAGSGASQRETPQETGGHRAGQTVGGRRAEPEGGVQPDKWPFRQLALSATVVAGSAVGACCSGRATGLGRNQPPKLDRRGCQPRAVPDVVSSDTRSKSPLPRSVSSECPDWRYPCDGGFSPVCSLGRLPCRFRRTRKTVPREGLTHRLLVQGASTRSGFTTSLSHSSTSTDSSCSTRMARRSPW